MRFVFFVLEIYFLEKGLVSFLSCVCGCVRAWVDVGVGENTCWECSSFEDKWFGSKRGKDISVFVSASKSAF